MADLVDRLDRQRRGDESPMLADEAGTNAALLRRAAAVGGTLPMGVAVLLAAIHWARYQVLPEGADAAEFDVRAP